MINLGFGATLALIAGIFAMFAILYVALQRNQRRNAADAADLRTWATDHSLGYADRDDRTWTGRWHFAPFGIGYRQHASQVVSGTWSGWTVAAFDYTYVLHGAPAQGTVSPTTDTMHFAVVVVALPTQLPWFDARRRTFHVLPHRDADAFPVGDEDFDRSYVVHAHDRSYALSAITPAVRSIIVDQGLTGIHVVDGRLFAWEGETHNKASVLPARLAALVACAAALPAAPVAG